MVKTKEEGISVTKELIKVCQKRPRRMVLNGILAVTLFKRHTENHYTIYVLAEVPVL